MKKLIYVFLFSLIQCITANINQPPYIVEKTIPPYTTPDLKKNSEFNNDSYGRKTSLSYEEEFFEELSKQDPYLNNTLCKRCIENQPPGYVDDSKTNIVQTNPSSVNTNEETSVVVITNSSTSNTSIVSEISNPDSITDENLIGIASWYGKDFDGRPTASGEIFDSRKLTAAHRTLPLGTLVNVKNLENNKEVILRINDRGPYVKNRILDVSEYAAELLGFKNKGLARVQIQILTKGNILDKGEGATAFFYKEAQWDMGSSPNSPYEKTVEKKKEEIISKIIPIQNFKSFSVQIANFTDIRNVIRIKEELEKQFPYPIFIVQRGSEYLIRIGSFSERTSAEALKQKLEENGYSGFITTPSP